MTCPSPWHGSPPSPRLVPAERQPVGPNEIGAKNTLIRSKEVRCSGLVKTDRLPLSGISEAKVGYSSSPRNRNPANRNHLDQSLSSSQNNRNSLTWVLVALSYLYLDSYRFSAESQAGEWEL